jgi:hypothetical protein
MNTWVFRSLATALAVACAAPASAASVSGKFELNGKALAPTEVAAFRIRAQYDARKLQTYVMLTTQPVDRQAIGQSLSPYVVAINDPAAQGDYLSLTVGADGVVGLNAHVGGTQYIDSSGAIMGDRGSLVANCTENTPARVACTVKSAKPVKTSDGTWTLDVAFDTDVTSRPAGKPIAKGGDAPGKALLELAKAVQGDDLEAILALLTEANARDYREDWRTPRENLEAAKDLLGVRVPKKPIVAGGELLADDHAVLEVEGEPWEGSKMLYLVEMRKANGRWVFDNATSEGLLD